MDDAQIVALYFQRQPQALAETQARYGAYCRAVAYHVLRSAEDAEECVNDTYLAAWNSIPPNRPDRLSAYLGRITRNFALTALERRRARKRGGGETALVLEELSECLPGGGSPEREYERRELAETLDRFLAALPDTERRVFLGRYWYCLTAEELAQHLGFSRSKISSMLFRTRKKLRISLEKEELL